MSIDSSTADLTDHCLQHGRLARPQIPAGLKRRSPACRHTATTPSANIWLCRQRRRLDALNVAGGIGYGNDGVFSLLELETFGRVLVEPVLQIHEQGIVLFVVTNHFDDEGQNEIERFLNGFLVSAEC